MPDTKRWIDDVKRVRPPELWEDIQARAMSEPADRQRRRGPTRTALVLVVALAVIGSALYMLRGLGGREGRPAVGPGEVVRYTLSGAPQPLAVGAGAAWVSVTSMSPVGTGPSTIARIDAVTGEVTELDGTTGGVWIAAGEGAVWATCNDEACGGKGVLELDPETGHVVRTIPVGGSRLLHVATGLGSVWVTTEDAISRIDPDSGGVGGSFEGAYDLLGVGGGSVWATTGKGVIQLDPETGRVRSTYGFPDPCLLEVTERHVFAESCDGGAHAGVDHDELVALDARTGELQYRVPVDGWGQMRLAGGVLWLAQYDPADQGYIRLVPLNPATGRRSGPPLRLRRDPMRFRITASFPPSVFFGAGEGSLWFTDFAAGQVIRVGLPAPEENDAAETPSPA